jgi:hypothetical protein
MKQAGKWIVGIVLTATAGFVAVQNGFTPGLNSVTPAPSITNTVAVTFTETPASTINDKQCAYVWASHDAPELTKKLDDAVKSINPAASARAELYGEDCVYSDGHSTFGVMETDFHVRLPADNLTNEEALGNWMEQVLPIIVKIPIQEIQGKFGFVEFWFEKNNTEHVIVRVPIQKYIDEAQGKTGAKLFHMFYIAP